MTPFFSIIIPLYNKEKHILKTLNSVFNQTFTDYEIILVNDGSTDNSFNEVLKIQHEKLFVFNRKNKGVSQARNFAMQQAKGDYFAFLDADDFWRNNHLLELNRLITHFPNAGMFCMAYKIKISSKNSINAEFKDINENHFGIVKDFFLSSLKNCIAWTSAVCVPKSVFNTLKPFDPKITLGAGEDTDLWIRIALNFPIAFSNIPTAIHNKIAQNRISNSNTLNRKFINLSQYNNYINKQPNLKRFLDFNRFAIALQYKHAGSSKIAKKYLDEIDYSNLNIKQKILINCNRKTLNFLFFLKEITTKHLKKPLKLFKISNIILLIKCC